MPRTRPQRSISVPTRGLACRMPRLREWAHRRVSGQNLGVHASTSMVVPPSESAEIVTSEEMTSIPLLRR